MSSVTEKAEKLNADIYESDFALINEVQKTRNLLSRKEAIHLVCDAYRGIKSNASEDRSTCPENCKNCELFGGLNDKEVLCILKMENKHPIFKHHSFFEAQACSIKSMLITLARKEELTSKINNLWNRLRYLEPRYEEYKNEVLKLRPISDKLKLKEKEIEELKKPIEALLTEKSNLQIELQDMKNALLERMEQIAVLETDNTQLRMQNEELSKDSLVEKNSFLTVQVAKAQKNVEDLKTEVEKLTALAEMKKQNLNEIMNQVSKIFGDFRRYAPTTTDPCEIHQYITKVLQRIETFEQQLEVTN